MHTRRLLACIGLGIALALAATAARGAGGGASNDPQLTLSNIPTGAPLAEGIIVSVTIQRVSYELNSVAGKYRLFAVQLRGAGRPGPVALSREQDRLVVLSGTTRINASFELSALDRALWDGLSPEAKNWLNYPDRLERDGAAVAYAFVPLADLKGLPSGFDYTIKSLPAPLLLRPEAKRAAALTGPTGG